MVEGKKKPKSDGGVGAGRRGHCWRKIWMCLGVDKVGNCCRLSLRMRRKCGWKGDIPILLERSTWLQWLFHEQWEIKLDKWTMVNHTSVSACSTFLSVNDIRGRNTLHSWMLISKHVIFVIRSRTQESSVSLLLNQCRLNSLNASSVRAKERMFVFLKNYVLYKHFK